MNLSMAINVTMTTISLDDWIYHFSSTVIPTHCWRKKYPENCCWNFKKYPPPPPRWMAGGGLMAEEVWVGGGDLNQSIAINVTMTTISLDYWIHYFSSSANAKHCWRKKNIQIQEKSFKSFWIQSLHFKFQIQNLRSHDQTRMFHFGFILLYI